MRFETSKRKLQTLTFLDFYEPTLCIMKKWTYPKNSPEFGDTDLDREFLLDLREVKILLDHEKEHKRLILIIFNIELHLKIKFIKHYENLK